MRTYLSTGDSQGTLPAAAAVATSNVGSLTGLQTIDGYTLLAGDLVLLTGQTTAKDRGLWVAAAGAWSRPAAMASGSTVKARTVAVINGTVNAKTEWLLAAGNAGIVVDTNAQTWVLRQSSALLTASPAGGLTGLLPVAGLISGINMLDYGADSTGVSDSAAIRDTALAAARQLRVPLIIPGGAYKWTTPLLIMSGDVYVFPAGWDMTTINFVFSTPGPAIDTLDPTDLCTGVRTIGGVRLFGDSTNTTEGILARSASRWNAEALRIDRGFTRHAFYSFGQRWKAGTNSSAGIASSQGPGGVLTAPVMVGDTAISLSATADYQESGFVKLLTPKSTIRTTTLSEVFSIPVVDASQFTASGAIQVAVSGETIFYTGRDLANNLLTGAIRRIDSRSNHSLAAGQTVYQAELCGYTGKSATQLLGVTRGQRLTTAITHGNDVAAPTSLAGVAAAGGTLTGTQIYRVTALNGALESIGSNEVSVVLGANGTVNLTWNSVPGATQYRVCRAAASGNGIDQSTTFITYTSGWLVNAPTTSFSDTGSVAPTIMGAPFGAYQNPGSATRNKFDDIHARSGAIAPVRFGGTIGADTGKLTTLNGAIGSGDTTVTVVDATQLTPPATSDQPGTGGYALIISTSANVTTAEVIGWTTKTATQLQTVTRGLFGTTAAAHSSGDSIYLLRRLWGGNSNQTECGTVQAEPDTNPPVAGTWLDQFANIKIANLNSAGRASSGASGPVGTGDAVRYGGYSSLVEAVVTGAIGANGYMFNFPDDGTLVGDNHIKAHDVEGAGVTGLGLWHDPGKRNNYHGYRAGVILRATDPMGADSQWAYPGSIHRLATNQWIVLDESGVPVVLSHGYTDFTTAGTYTWVVPPNTTKIRVRGKGGGGAGGSGGTPSSAILQSGGSGGAAGLVIDEELTVVPGETLTIVVGAGGTPGGVTAAGGVAGANGGTGVTTTITGSSSGALMSCTGGLGGKGATASSTAAVAGPQYGAYNTNATTTSTASLAPGGGGPNNSLSGAPTVGGVVGGGGGGNASATLGGGAGGAQTAAQLAQTAAGTNGTSGTVNGVNGTTATKPGCGGGGGGGGATNTGTGGNGGAGADGKAQIWY